MTSEDRTASAANLERAIRNRRSIRGLTGPPLDAAQLSDRLKAAAEKMPA